MARMRPTTSPMLRVEPASRAAASLAATLTPETSLMIRIEPFSRVSISRIEAESSSAALATLLT